MNLPEPTCPLGFTKKDLEKILRPEHIFEFCTTRPHEVCTGRLAKAERKSKLQYYASVCADDPHGWIWTHSTVVEFMMDENYPTPGDK